MSDSADVAIIAWEKTIPAEERGDPIWGLDVYRLARFALDRAHEDLRRHDKNLPKETRDQLLSSVASIAANVAEGYSRPSAADRARFYAYSLGSLRETIVWYSSLRDHIGARLVGGKADRLQRPARRWIAVAQHRRCFMLRRLQAEDRRWLRRRASWHRLGQRQRALR